MKRRKVFTIILSVVLAFVMVGSAFLFTACQDNTPPVVCEDCAKVECACCELCEEFPCECEEIAQAEMEKEAIRINGLIELLKSETTFVRLKDAIDEVDNAISSWNNNPSTINLIGLDTDILTGQRERMEGLRVTEQKQAAMILERIRINNLIDALEVLSAYADLSEAISAIDNYISVWNSNPETVNLTDINTAALNEQREIMVSLRPCADCGLLPCVCPPDPVIFRYEDFGAVGDGVTCDFDAIIDTHAAANEFGSENGAIVKATYGAVHRIETGTKTRGPGNSDNDLRHQSAIIQTDVIWEGATFIIDDTTVEYRLQAFPQGQRTGFYERIWRDSHIFEVRPTIDAYNLTREQVQAIGPFSKYDPIINLNLPYSAVIVARDPSILRFFRGGENFNPGTAQQDAFVIDENGLVDMDAPIIWDFPNYNSTTIQVLPIDDRTLTLQGGHFITINNHGNADDRFMQRGINVVRSNTVIDGITREIQGERIPMPVGTQNVQQLIENGGASYRGFVYFQDAANVTIQNSVLSGRRAYRRPSQTGTTRGTYDIEASRVVNMRVINVTQVTRSYLDNPTTAPNPIRDGRYWGIFASNFSKNIHFEEVNFSRMDSHMGVYNVTLIDSSFGHQGVSVVGMGLLYIENVRVYGDNFINLRGDYGSVWYGELVIINGTLIPPNPGARPGRMIQTDWGSGSRPFDSRAPGWLYDEGTVAMPSPVTIDGFHFENGAGRASGGDLFWVGTRNPLDPFVWTEYLFVRNLTSDSGAIRTSNLAAFTNQLTVVNL